MFNALIVYGCLKKRMQFNELPPKSKAAQCRAFFFLLPLPITTKGAAF